MSLSTNAGRMLASKRITRFTTPVNNTSNYFICGRRSKLSKHFTHHRHTWTTGLVPRRGRATVSTDNSAPQSQRDEVSSSLPSTSDTNVRSQIQQFITKDGSRGMQDLVPHLSAFYLFEAAEFILERARKGGKVFICTGFYILAAAAPETDGPPGAAAVARALQSLGCDVAFVTDEWSRNVVTTLAETMQAEVILFPKAGASESEAHAQLLIDQHNPDLVISVERPGIYADGTYRNFRGKDISAYTAQIDALFDLLPERTVAIGDGGNEIGMGALSHAIPEANPSKLPAHGAPETAAKHLIVASVSNWGGYALAAALAILTDGSELLISANAGCELLKMTVEAGAVDGITGRSELSVDGFVMDDGDAAVLHYLNAVVDQHALR